MFITGSMNVFSNDPSQDCPCSCDEIVKPQSGGDINRIVMVEHEDGCSIFRIEVTGCGQRTVMGFNLDFGMDPNDPCLNQNWTIKDYGTDMVLGVYNPTITNPTFGTFNPPVLPCESRDFSFKLCPEVHEFCLYKDYDVGINLIFQEILDPCPTLRKQLIFAWVSSVQPIDINSKIILNQIDGFLSMDFSNLENQLDTEGLILKINDVYGNLLMSYDIKEIKNAINIDHLISGKYLASISKKNEILGVFHFSVIK